MSDRKEDKVIEETKSASDKLDMWAKALGLSSEDIKNIKIGAVQDLVKEANEKESEKATEGSDTAKLMEKVLSSASGSGTAASSCVPGYGAACNTFSTMLPYLMMLGTLHSSPIPQPVTVHIHIDK